MSRASTGAGAFAGPARPSTSGGRRPERHKEDVTNHESPALACRAGAGCFLL